MSLQFIFGNSGSGKSHIYISRLLRSQSVIRRMEFIFRSGSGAVYNADAEGPVYWHIRVAVL